MKNVNETLETLLPGREIKIGGETVMVSPFTFIQLPSVLKVIGKMSGLFYQLIGSMSVTSAANGAIELDKMELVDLKILAAENNLVVEKDVQDDIEYIKLMLSEALGDKVSTGNTDLDAGEGFKIAGNKINIGSETIDIIMQMLDECSESVFELVKIGLKCDQAEVEKLQTDEGLDAILTIVEVNLDFFKTRLSPMMARLTAIIAKF